MNDAGSKQTIRLETRELARRLLIYESKAEKSSEPRISPTLRAYEKLRQNLGAFAGIAGFQSLASRALALARAEDPGLSEARVAEDGSLQGLGEIEDQVDFERTAGWESSCEAGIILIARLLGLLHIFLGETLTVSLLRVLGQGQPSTIAFRKWERRVSTQGRVTINQLTTGVPGLDEIVGGGLPEFSFNIIAGAPGSGKTTPGTPIRVCQCHARTSCYLLYGPRRIRHQDASIPATVHFLRSVQAAGRNPLYQPEPDCPGKGPGRGLEEITKEVEKANPTVVVVDSFRTMVRKPQSDMDLQSFIQRLALFLASWQATTFLIGECAEDELRDNPIFTVADGLFWLHQIAERNSIVRKLQIIKLRGQGSAPGLHTFRITNHPLSSAPRSVGR